MPGASIGGMTAGGPMGSGMVPSSAMGTSAMMAGQAATAAAAAAAAGAGMGSGMGQGQGQGQGMGMGMGAGSTSPGGGGSSRGGRSATNPDVKDGPPVLAEAPQDNDTRLDEKRGGDVGDEARRKREGKEPSWFTALPEAVRNAMKSREKKTPPRGYEQRLKKYFENIE